MIEPTQRAESVRDSFILYTEGLLRQMRSREGGSLHVLALQVKDSMDSLIAQERLGERMKAHCWKHVWHIPGCWRCEAREWRRKKERAAQIDGDERSPDDPSDLERMG